MFPTERPVETTRESRDASSSPPYCLPLAHGSERFANVFGKELRLFPGREMAANVMPLIVDELRIRLFRPATRRLVEFVPERAHAHRYGNALDVEKIELIFPVEARRRDPRV